MRRLSPSGAERWTACPASHYIAGKMPPLPSTSSAEEGTLAHEFAAYYLAQNLAMCYPNAKTLTAAQKSPELALASADMLEGAQSYADAVTAKICELGGALSYGIECELFGFDVKDPDFDPFVDTTEEKPAIKGRADFVATAKTGDVVVADYKFGEYMVQAKDNLQMTIYGIMHREHEGLSGGIYIGIIQPRAETAELLDLAASWHYIPADQVQAARDRILAAVDAAIRADAHTMRTPGTHCTFCPARSTCLASVAERLLLAAVAAGEAESSPDATDDQIGAWLRAVKAIDKVADDLARIAKARIAAGAKIPGYRVQAKRTLVWETDASTVPEQAVELAGKLGCDATELIKQVLRSPADMKKTIELERLKSCTKEQKSAAIVAERT